MYERASTFSSWPDIILSLLLADASSSKWTRAHRCQVFISDDPSVTPLCESSTQCVPLIYPQCGTVLASCFEVLIAFVESRKLFLDGSMGLVESWQCFIKAHVTDSSCVEEHTVLEVWVENVYVLCKKSEKIFMLILLLGGQRKTVLNLIQKNQTNLIIICFAKVNFRNMWPTHIDGINMYRVDKRPGITMFHDMS